MNSIHMLAIHPFRWKYTYMYAHTYFNVYGLTSLPQVIEFLKSIRTCFPRYKAHVSDKHTCQKGMPLLNATTFFMPAADPHCTNTVCLQLTVNAIFKFHE